jgi:PAS domain S-box-containing protein
VGPPGTDAGGMHGPPGTDRPLKLASGVALWAAGGVLVLGVWVVGEWALGSLHVARASSRFLPMAPTTALAFLVSGFLLLVGPSLRMARASRVWPFLLGVFLVVVAGVWADRLRGAGRAFPLLPPGIAPGGGPYFGRMSPWAALLFTLVIAATGLRFREEGGPTRRLAWSQALLLVGFMASGLVLAGLGFHTPLLVEGQVIPIAPPSALGFLLLMGGGLHDGEGAWGTRWRASPTILARLTRRTLPPLVAVVILGGWAMGAVLTYREGNARLLGAALLTSLGVVLIIAFTGWVALDLQREVDEGQRALQERERHLQTTLDSIGDGVIILGGDGRVQDMNPVAEALTGWSQAEARGQVHAQVVQFLDPEDRGRRVDLVTPTLEARGAQGVVNPHLLVARDGSERQVVSNAAPLSEGGGGLTGVVLVMRDLTQFMELEGQLRQSQKMDAIGQLSGGVAHDFNNLLAAIQGSADLLSLHVSREPTLRGYLAVIQEGTRRAADLTAKLLAFARKGKVVSTPLDVHGVLRDALQLLQRSIDPRIRVEVTLGARQSVIVGDPTLLENVFLNLGINARDAMPGGGTIRYRTRNVRVEVPEADRPPFHLMAGDYLEIQVEDTGGGIPAQVLPKIFDPFFTTKPVGKGTGLGLAAAFGTLKDHHGAIKVTTELGKGTTFTLLLPLSREVEVKAAPEAEPVPGAGCVLLIDDEPIVRSTASQLLASLGYSVLLAEDGIAGVATFQQHHDRIDLVMLDMVMPRLGGKETLARLREIQADVKVILCSGFDLQGQLEEVLSQGSIGFLHKPYRRCELAEALAKAHPAGRG